jgi:hypothetical protein
MKKSGITLPSPVNEIMAADPIFQFISERKIGLSRIVSVVAVYGVLYSIILPTLYGSVRQVSKDWTELIRALLVTPLLFGYYVWQPATIQSLYDLAVRRIPRPTMHIAEQISGLSKPLRSRLWFWTAIIFGILNSVIYYDSLLTSQQTPDWQKSNPVILFMSTLAACISFYSVFQILVRQVFIFRGINKFFDFMKIDIAPLHPDKAGGLRSLGQYVVTIGFGIGIIGLALAVSLIRSQTEFETLGAVFYLSLGVYLLAAPLFFFIPLLEAHNRMRMAKEKILTDVAKQYEELYLGALQKMKKGKLTDSDMSQLDAVRKMYGIADASPVWPFNIDILSKFSVAVILPVILPLVVSYLASFIVK